MTFSQQTKAEILKSFKINRNCCCDTFVYTVLKATGSLELTIRGIALSVSSENLDFLRVLSDAAYHSAGVRANIQSENTSARGAVIYRAMFDKRLLKKFPLAYRDEEGFVRINNRILLENMSDCCNRAFVQALFVSCGSLVVPDGGELTDDLPAGRYHMEFVLQSQEFAQFALNMLQERGFNFRITTRKNNHVLYIKESEQIADMLVFMNAMSAKLQLENVIIQRNLRNVANRQSNCISANIDKSIAASAKQVESIRLLQNSGKLSQLSKQLQEIASLRLANPDATMAELATMSGVTKSGVAHRLDKLVSLARQLEEGEN
ncbi:MAG TPA: DNA-binding protein WhiA [Candidatus Limihabitans stercoravium]|nr:DNA-binding protein WhiA [Candidatus Limihabitans stercoravium]